MERPKLLPDIGFLSDWPIQTNNNHYQTEDIVGFNKNIISYIKDIKQNLNENFWGPLYKFKEYIAWAALYLGRATTYAGRNGASDEQKNQLEESKKIMRDWHNWINEIESDYSEGRKNEVLVELESLLNDFSSKK